MEYECSPLNWEFFYQEEQGLEELTHSLLFTNLELEATIESAKEEIAARECELHHLNDLLALAIKGRDEAEEKCKKLMLQKLEVQTTTSQNEENEIQGCCSSESEENSSSSIINQNQSRTEEVMMMELAEKRPLPEKGKLLKAVVEAGPLLQSILLAGPLPQWQHPPPQLTSIEIPPLTVLSKRERERDLFSLSKEAAAAVDLPLSKSRKTTPLPTTTASHHFLPPPPHPSFS
ncbi:hypothetical protein HN51_055818 [Arachis hypogaea]|uniref:DUF1635 family protein n=1 Tax=Arachis hypogaea TaxID=3818 RepID=A0A444XRI8_ARAHY|nr:uncharacterized protein LOC107616603 isoform X2 [Arachis ipaensis]XP_025679543.1 uncharacterized protein LOC112779473 isoform X2 [Arachis hypogaea]QHN78597.1 DUF1635 family protein [Arachis hypogaea]RYQ92322.1 hypothetical protein Ahy_B09g098523 [Arachis hypogaea]